MYDKITVENQKKKIRCGCQTNLYINVHLKDGLGMKFTAY